MKDPRNTPALPELDEALRSIGQEFDQAQPLFDADLAFSGVFERVQEDEKSRLSALRSQPTWVRRAIALATITVIAILAGPLSPRPDIGTYPMVRMFLYVTALAGLGGLCAWVALKPLHVPAWSQTKVWAAITVAVVCTFTLCALPQVQSGAEGSAGGCFAYGFLLSIPVFAVVRVLDRGAFLSAVLAGAAGGLAGNLALQLHCPVSDRGHLLTGHFPVLVVFVLVGVGIRIWKLRQRPSA